MEENLQLYFESIKDYPILDAEVQKQLIKKAQQGDENAREQLIMSNSRFVVSFANQYRNVVGLSIAELISEGNMGLISAIWKFNGSKHVSFTSYASWWIRHYILRAIHQSSKLVRLPMNKVRLLQQIKREQQIFISQLEIGDADALDKAGALFNLSSKQVAELFYNSHDIFSLDREIQQDAEGHITFLDSLVDENEMHIDIQVEQNEQKDILKMFIAKIPKREATIIKQRYGLNGNVPRSLNDLSKIHGITKERIRQLEIKGIQRMKKMHKEVNIIPLAA